MNIVDTLTGAIQFEEKVFLCYRNFHGRQKDQPEFHLLWKEIIGHKEKQIQSLKKAVQSLLNLKKDTSRIHLIPTREMEEALEWIEDFYQKSLDTGIAPQAIHKMVHSIFSFELSSIYSPLLKASDLQLIKGDRLWIPLLTWHLRSLNLYFKKHRWPGLSSLTETYPFLNKREPEKKVFSEDHLLQSLLDGKKELTIHLKNGQAITGKLAGFDHFSIRCEGKMEEQARGALREILPADVFLLKQSIISIQLHD